MGNAVSQAIRNFARAVLAYFNSNNYRRAQAVLLVAIGAGMWGMCH